MKKISQVIMIVLGMMVVLTGKVWAQDGSLKINVDVPVQTNVNEQTYFEQDITLKQLFDASLSQNNRQKSHYLKRKIRLFFFYRQTLKN